MAITQNTLIGKSKGSVGNATFTTWKGRNVLKSKAQNAYSNPTAVQVQNNNRFGIIVAFARLLRSMYKIGFSEIATDMTEYNKFVQLNNPEAFDTSQGNELTVLADQVILAKGTGPKITSVTSMGVVGGGDFDPVILQSPENKSNANSTLYVTVFVQNTPAVRGTTSVAIDPETGGDSNPSITVPGSVVGDTVIFFIKDSVTGKISDSFVSEITA